MKMLFWSAYVLVALIVCYVALITGAIFHGFVIVLALVFGPKLWRMMS